MSTYDYGEPIEIRLGYNKFEKNDLDPVNTPKDVLSEVVDKYIQCNMPDIPLSKGGVSLEPDISESIIKRNTNNPKGRALPVDSVNISYSPGEDNSKNKKVNHEELIEEALSILNDKLEGTSYHYNEDGELIKTNKTDLLVSNFALMIKRSVYSWQDKKVVDRKLEITVFSKKHGELQNLLLTQKEFIRESWIANYLDISRYYYTPGIYASIYEASQIANMLMPIINEYRHIGWVSINDNYQYIDGGIEYYEFRK